MSHLLISSGSLLGAFSHHYVRISSHPHLKLDHMAESSSRHTNPSSGGFSAGLRSFRARGDIEMQDSSTEQGGGTQGKRFTTHSVKSFLT